MVFAEANFFETQVVDQLSEPTAMEFAPDGRLFVIEQGGTVHVIENGTLLSTPFLVKSVVNSGERGLLGITFDPNFAVNKYVYLFYTAPGSPQRNVITRVTANGNVAVANSEVTIFELDPIGGASVHNGGALGFGQDGKLYTATGDGGNDPSNAQNLDNLFGSILRLNSDGSIPTDNPFYTTRTGKNRAIWAYGLRNPFVFDIQPGTGRMHINDVGGGREEEIDLGQAGANYGWPHYEGSQDYTGSTPVENYVPPLYYYSIENNPECAITGGAFYNPPVNQFPASYTGDYFFADFCAGTIRTYDIGTGTVANFASNGPAGIVDLEAGPDGSLYYLVYATGSIHRIFYQASIVPPTISAHPQNVTVGVGEPAQFSCSATGTAPITYKWQRDNVDIPGATASTYLINATVLDDHGAQFRCIANNATNQPATSNAATLTIINGTAPIPEITITLPTSADPDRYEAGKAVHFSGDYTDPDSADANLPDSAFDWRIDFHHDAHVHPFRPNLPDRRSGSEVPDDQGHTETTVWLRVYLTVTDTSGLSGTVYADVFPLISELTLTTDPVGLRLSLDGQSGTTPIVVDSVAGVQRIITAEAQQTAGGVTYSFDHWVHGGARSHTITTPPIDTEYTARYMLNAPTNAAPTRNVFDTATPTLTWGLVTWAIGYEVQVASAANFRNPEYTSGELSADTFSVTTSALPNGTYYWRVRAKRPNGRWGAWSRPDSILVSP